MTPKTTALADFAKKSFKDQKRQVPQLQDLEDFQQ
eukprot:CAMPEP_0196995248 /NCGR_PEP_ID=MMETSP1380-20130617/1404_1 /TAXON_ID=5936 /ORGANISM="Euplotes crassus, Strain CT5" /LENGTH=34 /DNA_ID= /DNA_START= /DNA_END= /DNA_ORIENTATION=